MKTIQFKQQEFRVPDWAKYITEDVDGWCVWEGRPEYGDNAYYSGESFRRSSVNPVRNGYPAIMEI